MPRLVMILVVATALAAASHAEEPAADARDLPASVMFPADMLERLRDLARTGAKPPPPSPDPAEPAAPPPEPPRIATDLHLSAILWLGPVDWTIWLNGQRLKPGSITGDEFRLARVTPDHVVITVPWGRAGPQDIILQPRQTFIAATGEVIEGR